MILHARVNNDGTLITKLPKSLRGQKVIITVKKENVVHSSNWDKISLAMEAADNLNHPKCSPNKILDEIRTFRESK